MKDANDPHYWQDAVFKPMWIICASGEPVRQLLCIKTRKPQQRNVRIARKGDCAKSAHD